MEDRNKMDPNQGADPLGEHKETGGNQGDQKKPTQGSGQPEQPGQKRQGEQGQPGDQKDRDRKQA